MELETTRIGIIIAATLIATGLFVAAYAAPIKVSIGILLLLIPFQFISSQHTTANVLLAYIVAGALVLRGRLKYLPQIGLVLLVLLTFLVSMSQVDKRLWMLHGIYVFNLVSGFLLFILAYNLSRALDDRQFIIKVLIAANVAAVIYCLVQFSVGPGERTALFGIQELNMHRNRGEGDPRLVGPFATPGLTAAYLMSMTLILVHEIVHCTGWRKIRLFGLVSVNLGMMIATANRGSFLILLAGLLVFVYLLRSQLGLGRVIQVFVGTALALAVTVHVVLSYTDFGRMLGRLETTTEFVDGVPRTRLQTWPVAWEHIQEKPILGHGPRLRMPGQERIEYPGHLAIPYPHNLYLHLLFTVGIAGTIAMMWFLLAVTWRLLRAARAPPEQADPYQRGLLMLGALLVITFLADELKIEFLRNEAMEYMHFVFAMLGIFLGWADHARDASVVAQRSTQIAVHKPAIRPIPSAAMRPAAGAPGRSMRGSASTLQPD